MSWEILFALLVVAIAVSLLVGQWISFALGLVGVLIIGISRGFLGLESVSSIIWNAVNSYVLIAVPLFILMGEIILRSDLSAYFYRGMAALISRLPGGLLHANIGASALFSAICGSSVATAATIGTVAIPELSKRSYDRPLMFGSIAAGGTLGLLIPPSIAMILYGALVEESVAHLFMAGILPGIVLALMFSAYLVIRAVMKPAVAPLETPLTKLGTLSEALFILPVLLLVFVVLGSIYAGFATPTEAAAVGVMGAILMSVFTKAFTFKSLMQAIMSAVRTTSMLMFIVIGAQILSAALTYGGISRGVSGWIFDLGLSKWQFFFALVVLYLILGCIIDGISMMYLTLPILYPVVHGFGFDPIWFGVVLVILIEVGQITPPLGLNLFTIQTIAPDANLSEIVMGALPFVLIILLMILILCFFPSLALWIPNSALA